MLIFRLNSWQFYSNAKNTSVICDEFHVWRDYSSIYIIYGWDSQCNPDRQNTLHCAGRYLDSIEERWKKMALSKPTIHPQWIAQLIDISHLYWFSEFGDILPQHCQIYWKSFFILGVKYFEDVLQVHYNCWFLTSNILKTRDRREEMCTASPAKGRWRSTQN